MIMMCGAVPDAWAVAVAAVAAAVRQTAVTVGAEAGADEAPEAEQALSTRPPVTTPRSPASKRRRVAVTPGEQTG
jgi:hypothetical protein